MPTLPRRVLVSPIALLGLVAGAASPARADQARPVTVAAAPPAAAAAPAPAAAPKTPEPDSAAVEAGDANLASIADRTGLTFSASLGGGLIVGFGIKDSVGRGGAVSLRLGHVATPHTVITFELGVTAALHKPAIDSPTATNSDTNLLAGAQYYINPSLWLRFGGGLGVYKGSQVTLSSGARGDLTLIGPAMLVGFGVDLARFKWAVLGFELSTSAMINNEGVLFANSAAIGLAFD